MADVITSGASVIAPTVILGFESARAARTVVHEIINRAAPDVTLRPATMRTGQLKLGFSSPTAEADSDAAETLLASPAVFSLVSSDRITVQLAFVVQGQITRTLEDVTRSAWVVAFDWHEVAP